LNELVGVAPSSGSSPAPTTPTADPFYAYPDTPAAQAALAAMAPGTVLRSRTVELPWAGLPVDVEATQLLYRTTTELGHPTVTVTTVVRDLAARVLPTRIVSWQMFYDALGAECDPSYTLRGGNSAYGDAQEEEDLMSPYLAAGDTLVVSDYEGENLAWGAGQQSGYQTLDGIRAAESYLRLAESTTPVALIGYSGGAIATQWAAELAPAYAPDLHLVGAAQGGVPVDYAHNLDYINGSPDWSGVIPAILLGVARAFHIDLSPYLSAYGEKVIGEVASGCINSFVGNYPGLTIQELLKPTYRDFLAVPIFASIVNQLTMGTDGTPRIPLLFANGNSDGTGDGVMVAADVEALAHHYCAAGLPVEFQEYDHLDHTEAAVPFEGVAFPTIQSWLAGLPPVDGCATIGAGNALSPLPAGTTPPAPPRQAASYGTGTSVEPSTAVAVVDGSSQASLAGVGALTLATLPTDALGSLVGSPGSAATATPPPPFDPARLLDLAAAPPSRPRTVSVSICAVPAGSRLWAFNRSTRTWEPVADVVVTAGCIDTSFGHDATVGFPALTAPGGLLLAVDPPR
jgi:hypothetical protein